MVRLSAARAGKSPLARRAAGIPCVERRVAFYAHDTYGLGHLRRCLEIATALAADVPSVRGLILTGSPWARRFRLPPGFRYVELPAVVKTGPDEYRPRTARTSLEDVLAQRRHAVHSRLARFRPELLVVDNVPCGLHGELLTTLRQLKARGGTRLVLSLRDVIDEDAVVERQWQAAGAYEVLEHLYDEVWVFGTPEAPVARTVLRNATHKTIFCGPLGVNRDARPCRVGGCGTAADPATPPRILVTGGGGADARPLLETYVEAVRRFRPQARHRLVLGPDFPATPKFDRRELAALGLRVVAFERNLPRAMLEADLVVAMAGYNTVSEALALGRRLVLVPRTWPRREQWLRAHALASVGRATVVEPEALTPQRLWRAVTEALGRPAPEPALSTGGQRAADRAARLLAGPLQAVAS